MAQYLLPIDSHIITVDANTFSISENGKQLMIPKEALGVLVTNYDNILRDLEETDEDGQKYWSHENTSMYTKSVLETDDSVSHKVFCIEQAPEEMFLKKDDFQSMLIRVAILYRISADKKERTKRGLEYRFDFGFNETKNIIFSDNTFFSISDDLFHEEIKMHMNALVCMVVRKDDILRDLSENSNSGSIVYWEEGSIQIGTGVFANSRVFTFSDVPGCGRMPVLFLITGEQFERLVNIVFGGTSKDENDRISAIRELHWDSIPINFVGSFETSEDKEKFTLISKENGNTLTLPIAALQAIKKSKHNILADLKNEDFQLTRQKDFIDEYWSDGLYAVRTGPFYNLYRNSDCNVVRFTRLKDNYYEFIMKEKIFRSMVKKHESSTEKKKEKGRQKLDPFDLPDPLQTLLRKERTYL